MKYSRDIGRFSFRSLPMTDGHHASALFVSFLSANDFSVGSQAVMFRNQRTEKSFPTFPAWTTACNLCSPDAANSATAPNCLP